MGQFEVHVRFEDSTRPGRFHMGTLAATDVAACEYTAPSPELELANNGSLPKQPISVLEHDRFIGTGKCKKKCKCTLTPHYE